jgi:hypothetical protein
MQMRIEVVLESLIPVPGDRKGRTMEKPTGSIPHQKGEDSNRVRQGGMGGMQVKSRFLELPPYMLRCSTPSSKPPLPAEKKQREAQADQDDGQFESFDGFPFKTQRIDSVVQPDPKTHMTDGKRRN